MIKIKKLSEHAQLPCRGSLEAAGLDLHTIEPAELWPGCRATLRTGIAMALPTNYVGLIWPRSKLAAKMGIDVLAGVVDSDYRGEIMVSLLNTSDDTVEIRKGDKVAQMIIQEHYSSLPVEVVTGSLDETERGSAGINSSELRLR